MPSALASFWTPEPIASSAETGAASTYPTVIFPVVAALALPLELAAGLEVALVLPLEVLLLLLLLQAATTVVATTTAAMLPSVLPALTLTLLLLIAAHALPLHHLE